MPSPAAKHEQELGKNQDGITIPLKGEESHSLSAFSSISKTTVLGNLARNRNIKTEFLLFLRITDIEIATPLRHRSSYLAF